MQPVKAADGQPARRQHSLLTQGKDALKAPRYAEIDLQLIALIAQLNPIGALIVALLFGILSTGGTMMQSVIGVPTAIVDIIRGMIIIFAVAGMAMVKLPKVKAFLSSLGSKNKKAEVTA